MPINLTYIKENVSIMSMWIFFHRWLLKIFAYKGTEIVPMTQYFICSYFYWQLKIKLLNVSINARIVPIALVEVVCLEQFSLEALIDLTPSVFWMLKYKNFTSTETRYSICWRFPRNLVVCWTYDVIFLTIGSRWLSKYS